MITGQTYLVLFKLNFDSTTSLNAWALSQAQYDTFSAGGPISESTLDAASVGTSANQVWGKASTSDSISSVLDNLNIYMNAPLGVSATLAIDELRLSDATFNEAINPIPETNSALMIIGSLLLLFFSCRRNVFVIHLLTSPY